jgi:hypothetical protein
MWMWIVLSCVDEGLWIDGGSVRKEGGLYRWVTERWNGRMGGDDDLFH